MAEEEAMPVVPLGDRKLRACLATGLIKTEEQWFKDGCAAARKKLRGHQHSQPRKEQVFTGPAASQRAKPARRPCKSLP